MIYGGEKVIGYDWANGNVSMLHEDPSGLTIRSSIPQSPFVTYFTENDPWGAEVFLWDPYLDDPDFSGGRGESGPTYGGFGDISMPSTGCMLDGVYTLCDFVTRNSEALALELRVGGRTKQFSLTPGLLGMFAVWVEDTGQKLSKAPTPPNAPVSAGDIIVTNTDDDGLGHWELINLNPQSSLADMYKKVKETLVNSKCAQFAKDILNAVSSKKNPVFPDGGTLADVFDAFLSQPKPHDLFTTKLPKGSLGYGNPVGNIRKSTAQIAMPGKPDADGVIGELFHLAGRNKYYTDKQLAEAVRKFPQYADVANKALDPSVNIYDPAYNAPPDWTEENQGGYSAYFHYAQYNICFTAPANNGMKRLLR
jgi:hypothetical protein